MLSVLSRQNALAFSASLLATAGALLLVGCSSNKAKPAPRASAAVIAPPRDTPSILRGTIGAECSLSGADPVMVSGYGIVVDLNGTGSGDAPPTIRAWLERDLALKGVGRGGGQLGSVGPRQVIEDRNTAVVFVQAMVSPGAPRNATFDVLITSLPGSATTSLEGGRLMSTELRPGLFVPGDREARVVAEANGAVFINPFADPAKSGEQSINRTTARVLDGGVLTEPFDMLLTLDSPSHARARAIQNAINDAFPRGTGDREETAKGRNDEAIAITIPSRFNDNPGEFVRLLLSSRIDRAFPNEWATRYINAMREEPALADDLSWCLQALGPSIVPQLRLLYDYSEPKPRLSALRAGAELGDALVTPHLREIAEGADAIQRVQAIRLLADMPPNPQLNLVLRELVDADDITVRISAYEALAARSDPSVVVSRPMGVERTLYTRPGDPGEFRLDVVRSNKPMIYISQQGEPRVVVFGESLSVERPTLVYAWDDRLLVVGDETERPLRVRYQDWRAGTTAVQSEADANVAKLIEFFAHKPTPESPAPGLAMTYSEVVGALYELTDRSRAIPADFVAEQDRLQAELLALVQTEIGTDRPELAGEGAEITDDMAEPVETIADESGEAEETESDTPAKRPSRFVVPIAPKTPPKKDGGE
jgi:hypothetical protein